MTRCIAFFLALTVASLTVSSACLAADPLSIRITSESHRGANWSSAVAPSRLIALQIG